MAGFSSSSSSSSSSSPSGGAPAGPPAPPASVPARDPVLSMFVASATCSGTPIQACGGFSQLAPLNKPTRLGADPEIGNRLPFAVVKAPAYLVSDRAELKLASGMGLTLLAAVRFPTELDGSPSSGRWLEFKGVGTGAANQGSLTIDVEGKDLAIRVTVAPGYRALWSGRLVGAVDGGWGVVALRLTQLQGGAVGSPRLVRVEAMRLPQLPQLPQPPQLPAAGPSLAAAPRVCEDVHGALLDQTWNSQVLGAAGTGTDAGRTSHVAALALYDVAAPDAFVLAAAGALLGAPPTA